MNAQLDWDDFRIVLAVARHGSLSAAARILGVTHSTVLRRIAAFEDRIGTTLFDRLPGGYVLTATGEEVRDHALRMEEEAATASRLISGRDAGIEGSLRVTTIDILALHILPRPLAEFRRRYPGIKVTMLVDEASLSLPRREADIAIRATRTPPDSLIGRRISKLAFASYRHRDLPARPAEQADWVGLDDNFARTPMSRYLAATVPPDRVGCRFNSMTALIEAVAAGLGQGLLPCGLADRRPEVLRCSPPVPELMAEIWLLTHADLRHMGRVRVFLDFIAGVFAQERAWLEGEHPASQGP